MVADKKFKRAVSETILWIASLSVICTIVFTIAIFSTDDPIFRNAFVVSNVKIILITFVPAILVIVLLETWKQKSILIIRISMLLIFGYAALAVSVDSSAGLFTNIRQLFSAEISPLQFSYRELLPVAKVAFYVLAILMLRRMVDLGRDWSYALRDGDGPSGTSSVRVGS